MVSFAISIWLTTEGTTAGRAVARNIRASIRGNSNTQQTAGRDIVINILPATTKEFADAPNLLWSGVQAVKTPTGFQVVVACANAGTVARVMPDSWVRSTVTVVLEEQPEQMTFIDTQGPIHPGTFFLRMRSGHNPLPGHREVAWRVVYRDAILEKGLHHGVFGDDQLHAWSRQRCRNTPSGQHIAEDTQ